MFSQKSFFFWSSKQSFHIFRLNPTTPLNSNRESRCSESQFGELTRYVINTWRIFVYIGLEIVQCTRHKVVLPNLFKTLKRHVRLWQMDCLSSKPLNISTDVPAWYYFFTINYRYTFSHMNLMVRENVK